MVAQKCKFKVARNFAVTLLLTAGPPTGALLLRVAPRARDDQKHDADDSTDGCYQNRQH
jgi:hypothetical protein